MPHEDFAKVVRGRTVMTKWYRWTWLTATGEESEPSEPRCPMVEDLQQIRELLRLGFRGPALVTTAAVGDAYFGEVIAAALEARGVGDLHGPLEEAVRGYSLGNSRHVALYEHLTGDWLRDADFWPGLKEGRTLRNRWAHGRQDATTAQGERFLAALVAFVGHVERVLDARGIEAPPTEVRVRPDPEHADKGAYAFDLRRKSGRPWPT